METAIKTIEIQINEVPVTCEVIALNEGKLIVSQSTIDVKVDDPNFDFIPENNYSLQDAINADDQIWVYDAENLIKENIPGAKHIQMGLQGFSTSLKEYKQKNSITVQVTFEFSLSDQDYKKLLDK